LCRCKRADPHCVAPNAPPGQMLRLSQPHASVRWLFMGFSRAFGVNVPLGPALCLLCVFSLSLSPLSPWLFHCLHLPLATPVSLIVSFPAPVLSHSRLVSVSCRAPVLMSYTRFPPPPIYCASSSRVSCWIVVFNSVFPVLLVPCVAL